VKFDLALISPPLTTILANYLKTARRVLFAVLVTTMLGTLSAIGAPYLFSRLIDQLPSASVATGLIWAFMAYAVLMGAAYAFQRMSSFLTFMTSESLNFVTSTSFFARLIEKTSSFFSITILPRSRAPSRRAPAPSISSFSLHLPPSSPASRSSFSPWGCWAPYSTSASQRSCSAMGSST
jgi:ABC-type multidrug transport system fused ATPase/permease subunit